jgi:hypothetical protein
MNIVSRSGWGGPPYVIGSAHVAPMMAVTAHHFHSPALPATATAEEEREAMRRVHATHRGRGWAGIGYHFVIFQSGRVYEARGWGRVGSHAGAGGGNRTLGVAFAINGMTTRPSRAAMDSLGGLRDEGVRLGHLARGHALKHHRDWMATECPGREVVEALRAAPAPSHRVAGVVIGPRASRSDVEAFQSLMVRFGYMTQQEMDTGIGIPGPRTRRALTAFMEAHQ